MAQSEKSPAPYGVDPAFTEGGETRHAGRATVGRPVSELLADDAGPSSPFGATSLPLPPDEVVYELPDDEPPAVHPVRDE